MHIQSSRYLFLLVACSGCASSSHGQQVREAQMQGINERQDAQNTSAERRADRRDDAIGQRYDEAKSQVKASNQPDQKSNQKLVELSKDRAEFRSRIQTRMEKISTRIDAAHQKIDVLGPRAPTALHSELHNVSQQYDLLKNDVMSLDTMPDAQFSSKKSVIDQRADALDERVAHLNDSIGAG